MLMSLVGHRKESSRSARPSCLPWAVRVVGQGGCYPWARYGDYSI